MTGSEIKKIRAFFDESQDDFAKRVGVRVLSVWRWENDKNKPTRMALAALKKLITHGVSCPKVDHEDGKYLHGVQDHTTYLVDGVKYCGRCHYAMDE